MKTPTAKQRPFCLEGDELIQRGSRKSRLLVVVFEAIWLAQTRCAAVHMYVCIDN